MLVVLEILQNQRWIFLLFVLPELRGEFGAGLLDLHSMDDSELLTEHVMSEPLSHCLSCPL
ncbi:hypothetical protein QJS10_CPA01g00734 [Acorus calamus]|uniref:Uncharacterized protein n=1 Tax=Acorus calamus TaxID=4465 RepID=A0AAV9FJV3_ACOCL|nr:hypothetical protein QJS10_CPA01g00734 [Acorus calamus]